MSMVRFSPAVGTWPDLKMPEFSEPESPLASGER